MNFGGFLAHKASTTSGHITCLENINKLLLL